MRIDPYLYLGGRAEKAIAFYEATLGASRGMAMRFSESPDPLPEGAIPPDYGDKIMHAEITIGDAKIMISDGCGEAVQPAGFSLTLTVDGIAEAERVFAALAEGGDVRMPMGETFFAMRFGMLADRFGVPWTVIAPR